MFWNSIKIFFGIALISATFETGLNWISFFTASFGLMLALSGFTGLLKKIGQVQF
jgi:hypothetical protein